MGKAGRVACIFTPMALTLASLICIILVGMGGTNKNSSTLNNLYFFKANAQNVTSSLESLVASETGISSSDLSAALSSTGTNLTTALGLKDFYTVALWNYCDGSITTSSSSSNKSSQHQVDHVEYCSPRKAEFYFNPVQVWGLDNSTNSSSSASSSSSSSSQLSEIESKIQSEIHSYLHDKIYNESLKKGLATYKAVAKWMFIAYAIAFFATIAEFILGFFAIFSRWGSFVTSIASTVAFIFTLAASITSTALYASLAGTFDSALKKYGIHGSMGKQIYVTTWLAVAFAAAAGLFWVLSTCCCSGRSSSSSPSKRGRTRSRGEKDGPIPMMTGGASGTGAGAPLRPGTYGYDRVPSPYMGHDDGQYHGGVAPAAGAGGFPPHTDYTGYNPSHNIGTAMPYEPYRHREAV
ncbi:hypothetical protein L228DRAFT_266538 [Xylona heveae TC161]|uniref:Integral membrane protein n=1 Tax=Xylona heveae (strain CBS 132557 / TC161) TaxID=1328760 RepID=A0A165I0D0_XYLHT|nr:hypothetical protein L228DRAFT_266538 [Xylona heveae TC161]KZF24179.1 hypothetical protein L228DRAFT_266538 [Xylona heveae TC161]